MISRSKVAIDPDSFDQTQLSNIEFKDQPIDFHKITFMSIRHYLSEKKVDMAIWTEEDMENQLGTTISMRSLSEKTAEIVGGRNTKAALVTRINDYCHTSPDPKGDRSRSYPGRSSRQ